MADQEQAACLVPAAGRSQRMGLWKPALPFRGSTIIQTAVATALAVCDTVIVVSGYRAAELDALFAREPRVRIAHNPDWEKGMFTSIQCGASQIATERFFIALGDMPFLAPAVFRSLLAHSRADVVCPVFGDRRGHPVLLGARARKAILNADPAVSTMREVLSGLAWHMMPWDDDSILRDIDTAADYTNA